MCSVVGVLAWDIDSSEKLEKLNSIMSDVWFRSHERGRDGRGYMIQTDDGRVLTKNATRQTKEHEIQDVPSFPKVFKHGVMIGNLRAEPTTEFVKDKHQDDQQPYQAGCWSIVHNGTIANDKELRTNVVPTIIDSAAIAEQLQIGAVLQNAAKSELILFKNVIDKLRGSYAILATHSERNDRIWIAANYRPIWYIRTELGVFFASSRGALDFGLLDTYVPEMVDPYTCIQVSAGVEGYRRGVAQFVRSSLLAPEGIGGRALVVCSGGLDSVVSATFVKKNMGMVPHLIHFLYGSRAEGKEVEAVKAVASALGAELTLFPLPVYRKEDSPLLDADSPVAGGEEGAEFAHEWVPARNLLLLSVATAFAEARGISTIVLGNNLEEAGAYPDNEPEFIYRFNDLLPFAVGDGKRMRVIMPVGNMMKHEIVNLGHRIDAPMHLTWSCYRAGKLHCGKCGPCFMRKKAFEINGLPEVIEYTKENNDNS
jgi:7-cyano-7-deazaguanine synthase